MREVLKKTMFKSFTTYSPISTTLADGFFYLCYLMCSHPLHFAYFLFFFPYLVQLLSFLSPLLLSTFLLFVALLAVSPCWWLYEPPPGSHLRNTIYLVLCFLTHNLQHETAMETLDQLSSMVFPAAEPESTEGLCFHVSDSIALFAEFSEPASLSLEDENGEKEDDSPPENLSVETEGSPLKAECRSQECTKMAKGMVQNIDENVRKAAEYSTNLRLEKELKRSNTVSSMNLHEVEESKIKVIDSMKSPTQTNQEDWKLAEEPSLPRIQRTRTISRDWESLRRENSMSKEREWRRTLACKLYEERVTFQLCQDRAPPDGGEEMDLLWEAYETNASKSEGQKNKAKMKEAKKCLQEEQKDDGKVDEEVEEEEEEDDDDEASRQFCCLQALRLSTGKIKVGVGRSNLVKMSKILKGFTMFRVGNRSFRKE